MTETGQHWRTLTFTGLHWPTLSHHDVFFYLKTKMLRNKLNKIFVFSEELIVFLKSCDKDT